MTFFPQAVLGRAFLQQFDIQSPGEGICKGDPLSKRKKICLCFQSHCRTEDKRESVKDLRVWFAVIILGEMRKSKEVTVTVVSWSSQSCFKSDCSKECVTDPHACDCGMESIYVSVNMKLWNTHHRDGAGEVLVWPGRLSLDLHLSGSTKWIWTYCRTSCCWRMIVERETG